MYVVQKKIKLSLSSSYESNASELLENIEYMFPRCQLYNVHHEHMIV